jgi:hypothetical protein
MLTLECFDRHYSCIFSVTDFKGGTGAPYTDFTQLKVKILLRPTAVCLCVKSPTWAKARFLLLWDSCGFVDVGRPLWHVCRLQLLLALASAVILGSKSRVGSDILLPQIRDSPNMKGLVPIFISPRNRVPFSLPPTTRRVRVEVLEPASKRATDAIVGGMPALAEEWAATQ